MGGAAHPPHLRSLSLTADAVSPHRKQELKGKRTWVSAPICFLETRNTCNVPEPPCLWMRTVPPSPRVVTKVAACVKVPGRRPEAPVNTRVHTKE